MTTLRYHLPYLVYYLLYNHAGRYYFAFTNFQCSTATSYVCLNYRRYIHKKFESHLKDFSSSTCVLSVRCRQLSFSLGCSGSWRKRILDNRRLFDFPRSISEQNKILVFNPPTIARNQISPYCFDTKSLCILVRTGQDVSHVINRNIKVRLKLNLSMDYPIKCSYLWAYWTKCRHS